MTPRRIVSLVPSLTEALFALGLGDRVVGVRTGDKGIDRNDNRRANFEPGIDLLAKVTVFGEGARGSLVREIEGKLGLYEDSMPPVYETGIKEVLQLPEENYFTTSEGNDIHLMGYPLGMGTPGGGFIYEMKESKIAINADKAQLSKPEIERMVN